MPPAWKVPESVLPVLKASHIRLASRAFGSNLSSRFESCRSTVLQCCSLVAIVVMQNKFLRSGWKAVLHICAAAAQDPALSEAVGSTFTSRFGSYVESSN